jgi:glycosyltransferase involved in cell wall biosynthesis
VEGLADELIIGDTGSTDESVEIARHFGAHVVSIPWKGSYAEARNTVLGHVTGSWVLVLDGDEALELSHREVVKHLVDETYKGGAWPPESGQRRSDAYYLDRRHYVRDVSLSNLLPLADPFPPLDLGAIGYFSTHDVRLFRARPEYRYEGALHESLEGSLWAHGVTIARASPVIHHYGPCKPRDESREKALRYVMLARTKSDAAPNDWKAKFELAVELKRCGEICDAFELLRGAIEQFPEQWEIHLEFGVMLVEQSAWESGVTVLRRVIEARPHLVRGWYALGVAFLALDDLETASACFDQCQQLSPDEGASLVMGGVMLLLRGEIEQAEGRFSRIRKIFPRLAHGEVGSRLCRVLSGEELFVASGLEQEVVTAMGGERLWKMVVERGGVERGAPTNS